MTMLDYYTLEATLDKLSNDNHTYTKADLATLCRTKKLTPLFSYNLYGIEIEDYAFGNPSTIHHISGYLTNPKLLDLLDGLSDSISLIDATVIYDSNDPDNSYTDMFGYQVMLIDKPFNYFRYKTEDDYNPYNETKPFTVTKDHIRFKRDEVEALADHTQTSQSLPNTELAHNSKVAVARMLYGILKHHDYDLSAHKGITNDIIVSASKASGKAVTKNFVSEWLKLVQQIEANK